MEVLIQVIINSLFMICTFEWFLRTFFVKNRWKPVFLWPIGMLIIWQWIIIIYRPTATINMLVNIFIFLTYALLLYKGDILAKLAFSTFFQYLSHIIELLVGNMFLLLNLDVTTYFFLGSMLSNFMILLMVLLIKILKSFSIKTIDFRKYYVVVILILVGRFIGLNGFIWPALGTSDETVVIVWMIVSILSNIIGLQLYQSLLLNLELQLKKDNYIQQLKLKGEHQDELELMFREARQKNHDFRYHIITISEYINNNRIDDAYDYTINLLENDGSTLNEVRTGNLILDGIINAQYLKMKQAHIEFELDCIVSSNLPFKNIDLSTLFGNILENAMEATLKDTVEQKFIQLYIKYNKPYLVIICINSYDGTINTDIENGLQTTKDNKQYHGFGVPAIKTICDSYNGQVKFEYDTNSFSIKVILNSSTDFDV